MPQQLRNLGGIHKSLCPAPHSQGLGTWSWGNQFLWGYDTSMDTELQEVFNLAASKGVNLFDTADSYGTGRLNGR